MFLSPDTVLRKGLQLVGIDSNKQARVKKETNVKLFRAFFGSSPLDLAQMWMHLCYPTNLVPTSECNERGFKSFMASHYFLWHYPKNAKVGAAVFGACEKLMQGKLLWTWLDRIRSLKKYKVKWLDSFSKPNTSTFVLSVDCVDFKIEEPTHPTLPKDKSFYSHKHGSAGLKYEIGISIFHSKVVWIAGPFRCGRHDATVFGRKGGLKDQMVKYAPGKRGIADGVYSKYKDILSLPNPNDNKELHNFKTRARMRHEVFNGRVKHYQSMSQCWRHGIEKHQIAAEAVMTTVCYQMDNGARLFDV